jgi:cytochrome c
MTNAPVFLLRLSILVGTVALPVFAQQPPSSNSLEANRIIALVDKASALVAKEGKKAFAEFRKKGSEWFTDET